MQERPPDREVAVNILNKQSQTAADKGWSSSLGVGQGANSFSPQNLKMLQNFSLQLGLILWL